MQRQRSTLTGGVPGTGANAEWANMRQPESFAVLHGIISTDIGNRTRGSRQQQQHADEEEEEKEEGELAVQREQQQQLETERARAKIAMLSGEGSQQQQQQWQGPRQPLPGLGNCTIDGESPVYLRSLEWEVRLGSLGRDFRSWAAEATTQRQEYDIWRAKYLGDDKMQVKTSVELGNQADLAEAYLDPAFQRMPTKKIIVEDVNRTLSDVKLFTQDDIRCILKRILYVYACLNPAIGYIQGMNEILAPIVHVLHRDATYAAGRLAAEGKGEKGEEERVALMEGEYIRARSPAALAGWEVRGLIRNLRRLDCIESDAFRLFSKVMASIGAWFHSPKAINGEHDSAEEMEVVIKCARTQELLRIRDPAVFNQLKAMDIQPQLYMLKWIRILFAQIFPLENLLAVWDALFTAGIAREPFDLVDHICVTLLTLIRTSSKEQHLIAPAYIYIILYFEFIVL